MRLSGSKRRVKGSKMAWEKEASYCQQGADKRQQKGWNCGRNVLVAARGVHGEGERQQERVGEGVDAP